MTWAEFKQSIESQGINDHSRIRFIDWTDWYHPQVNIKQDGSFVVFEGSQRVNYDE